MIGSAVRSTPAKIAAGVLAVLVVAAMIASAIANGPAGALGALIVAAFVLLGLGFFLAIPTGIVVLIIAAGRARRAESGLMQSYATARGLSYAGAATLPEATPLLSAGSSRETQDLMTGTLPGGLGGTLAHYTYLVRSSSGSGSNRSTRYIPYPNTVVLVQLPETAAHLRKLLCYGGRRLGGRASLFGLDFSGDDKVELESSALRERYRITTASGQDQAWLRELFTPIFIDWLATSARPEFSFELVDGLLVVSVADRLGRPAELDWLCQAAGYVAGRIRGEVLEESLAPTAAPGA
jgi:hypothetical protein